ncbi:phosphatidate cytidylyltransferase [bacterium]|nr:phosphatidate cytidylyltransferase [bacterium]
MHIQELGKRVAVAGVGIPLILLSVIIGHWLFLAVVLVIQTFMIIEFYGLVRKKALSPNLPAGLALTLILTSEFYLFGFAPVYPTLIIAGMLIMVIDMFRGRKQALSGTALTLLGVIYVHLFSFFVLIRESASVPGHSYSLGGRLIIQIFGTIWICDTAAYFGGRRFGRHKLFPRVSPKKTWEGAIAGFIGSIAAALLLRLIFVHESSVNYAVALGCIVGIFGQIGDLVESFFKRDADVKDSGSLLPGHGGFLDRFDSPLFVAPLVFALLSYFGL